MQFYDVGMVEFFEDVGFFLVNLSKELLRVCMVFGCELDSEVFSIVGGQFDSGLMDSYLPKVPSPSVSMI